MEKDKQFYLCKFDPTVKEEQSNGVVFFWQVDMEAMEAMGITAYKKC